MADELTNMSDAHLSTECVFEHPQVPVHLKTKFATTNVKLLLQELLLSQLADYKAANDTDIDLTTHDVKVLRRYPRQAIDLPCITIHRSAHEQEIAGLGQVIGEGEGGKEIKAFRQQERIEIQIYADNEDVRDALYAYVTQTLAAYTTELAKYGIETINLVDGNDDEVDDQVFTHSYLYRGTLIYQVMDEMQIEDTYVVAKAVHATVSALLGGGETPPGSTGG